MKPTFFSQLFSGIFLIFWAIATLFLALGIASFAGYDVGVGDGSLLFWFTAGVIALIFAVNYFNTEQRAARGDK